MAVRMLIMSMSVVLWMIQLSQVASNLNPKPKCNTEYCGGVQISYPFGIYKNCYYDKSFEIECKDIKQTEVIDGAPQLKPYLKIIDLEVMDINGNDLKVIVPVNFTSCKDAISDYDLRATPFSFSSSNIFVGVGCNIIAYTTDRDDDISVWCDPGVCNLDSNSNVCVIKLKQNIQRLSPMVQSTIEKTVIISNRTRNQKDACGFGYLVDENFFSHNIQSQQHVVVNMEWELYNVTSASFGVDNVTTSCETKPQWFQVNNMFYSNSSLQCSCRHGYEGDPYRPNGCQAYSRLEHGRKKIKWKLVVIDVSSAIGALVLVFLVWWLYKVVRKEIIRKKKEKYFIRNGGLLLKQQISSNDGSIEKTKVFSSYELEKATDDYNVDRVLGQGGQGTVYKGMLSNGKIIAVKKSKILDTTKVGQFINEVVILSQINHKNVVKLLGCCLETEVPLLVYEFISNGTLFQHIHDPNEDLPLTWDMRLRIATEIAGALSYMHSAASMPIYHRDIKSTNILLDEKYKAKVSDFGISRSVDVDRTHLTTLVQGTFGYLDPEYFQSSQFTEKSDVYSFGVVLVELLTGQKPIFSNTSQEFRGLAPHFLELMEQNNFLEMIDPQISKEGKIEEMTAVAHLAKMCLNSERKKRPTMKEVGVQLERIRISRENDVAQGYSGIIENNTIDPLAKAYDTSSTSTESWSEISTASSPEEYQLYIGK